MFFIVIVVTVVLRAEALLDLKFAGASLKSARKNFQLQHKHKLGFDWRLPR